MLVLKPYDSSLLKSAVAAVANIIDTNAAICYNEDGVSLYVYGKFRGLIIATLHLLPAGFEIFDCGKPGHIYIDLTAFCEKLNMATDQEAIEISFGDIRRIKIPKGDRMIIFRFKDMGTDKIRCHQMEFRKFKEVPEFAERYDDIAIGVPSQEFNRVFEELAIPGEAAGADDNDLLNISVNNEQLRFLRKNKEIILMKELGKYEIRGATIDDPIELECSIDWGRSRSCLKAAVNMTDETLLRIFYKIGGHQSGEDFALRGKEPKDQFQIYTWKDATLRELTTLGGNDHEIYESERTVGHTVTSPEDTVDKCKSLFLANPRA